MERFLMLTGRFFDLNKEIFYVNRESDFLLVS